MPSLVVDAIYYGQLRKDGAVVTQVVGTGDSVVFAIGVIVETAD